ncbi:hypothetical protein CMEL01_10654 [Colletotrichum melonis]|uniref:Uncharacterized protein n=1 Tax=Colletotrichum melonis TaxID=1209925 RepID=A0AAI9TV19_9PEZI|nr:hypothetical protein CMEL01_10654 [Colletotrichum melonis]
MYSYLAKDTCFLSFGQWSPTLADTGHKIQYDTHWPTIFCLNRG